MTTSINILQENPATLVGPGVLLIWCSVSKLAAWEHDNLSAPYWRWYWNDAKGASIRTPNGERIELAPDRVVIIPPQTPFSSTLAAGQIVPHLHIHFTAGGGRLQEPSTRPFVRKPSAGERRQIVQLFQSLRARSATAWSTHFAAHALVTTALSTLPADAWQSQPADTAIMRLLSEMHDRPERPLENAQLARLAALGEGTLRRRFALATGTTPHRYLLQLRVDRAAVLLRTTDVSIDAIASATGFCDRFHLSRAFQKHFNQSPAKFRRAHRSVPSRSNRIGK